MNASFRTLLFSTFAVGLAACGVDGAPAGEPGTPETAANAAAGPTVGTPGSHVSIHDLLLFGSEKTYVSHLPIFRSPHDLQVVAEVTISPTLASTAPLANQLFSFQPAAPFSLYDFAHGTLTSIVGTIFLGNLEAGAPHPVLQNVTLNVGNVVYASSLLPETPRSPTLDYLALGTLTETYFVHVLDAPSAWDQVSRVTLPQDTWLTNAALAAGTKVSIAGGVNDITTRVRPDAVVEALPAAPRELAADTRGSVTFGAERSCLEGDGYSRPCAP